MSLVPVSPRKHADESKSDPRIALMKIFANLAIQNGETVELTAQRRVIRVRHRDVCAHTWPNCYMYIGICEWCFNLLPLIGNGVSMSSRKEDQQFQLGNGSTILLRFDDHAPIGNE